LASNGVWNGNFNDAGRIEIDLPKAEVGDNEKTAKAVKDAILALNFDKLNAHASAMNDDLVITIDYSVGNEDNFYSEDGVNWYADIQIKVECGWDTIVGVGSIGLEIVGK